MKRILLEMVPVILGILIALFINNWKEDHANKRFVEQALQTIETEIQENINSLNRILPRHYSLLEALGQELENDSLSLEDIIIEAGGIQLPTIRSASWKFFLNSKTELIDYPIVSALIEMDEAKRVLDLKFEQLLTYGYQQIKATDKEHKERFVAYFANLVDSEQTLQSLYEEYLDQDKE